MGGKWEGLGDMSIWGFEGEKTGTAMKPE